MKTEIENDQLEQSLEDLLRCAENMTRYLQAIIFDLKEGEYTPEKARRDHEEIMYADDMDFVTCLTEVAEYAGMDSTVEDN